jgi:hypothetical protein
MPGHRGSELRTSSSGIFHSLSDLLWFLKSELVRLRHSPVPRYGRNLTLRPEAPSSHSSTAGARGTLRRG